MSSQPQVTQPREETHSLPESQGLLQRKNEVLMPEVEGMNYEEKEQQRKQKRSMKLPAGSFKR